MFPKRLSDLHILAVLRRGDPFTWPCTYRITKNANRYQPICPPIRTSWPVYRKDRELGMTLRLSPNLFQAPVRRSGSGLVTAHVKMGFGKGSIQKRRTAEREIEESLPRYVVLPQPVQECHLFGLCFLCQASQTDLDSVVCGIHGVLQCQI